MLVACTKTDTTSDAIPVVTTQKTILALGDSLTAGYGLPEADSYPSQLQKKLKEKGYEYQIQNAWISGDTSAGLLSRMDWILDSTNTSPASTSEYALAILCIGGTMHSKENLLKISRKISELLSRSFKQKKFLFSLLGWRLHLISVGNMGSNMKRYFLASQKNTNSSIWIFF